MASSVRGGLIQWVSDKEDICEVALAQNIFVRVILFLWITNNVKEIVITIEELMLVYSFPSLPEGLDPHLMVHDVEETKATEHYVVCANTKTKCTLCTLVYIPKLLIVYS